MKKILLTLAVLMLASPAWADVIITAVADGNEVVISYDASTEAVLPRAFSLNIQSDDANIVEVGDVNPDFPIHPGTISIDLSGPEPSIDYGTPVAPQSDLPSDTLPGLGTPGITIEMGSLYAPTGPGSPNAPAASGVLLKIYTDGAGCLTFTGNVARAGSSGVVLEDPALAPTVTVPAPGSVCTTVPDMTCMKDTHPAFADWDAAGRPDCWCYEFNCKGDADGLAQFGFRVLSDDLAVLAAAYGQALAPGAAGHCADFDRAAQFGFRVLSDDLLILAGSYGQALTSCDKTHINEWCIPGEPCP
jgi:hypothetical protein